MKQTSCFLAWRQCPNCTPSSPSELILRSIGIAAAVDFLLLWRWRSLCRSRSLGVVRTDGFDELAAEA